jgi:hypothetical protein
VQIAVREEVFDAKLQAERDKGFWTRNIQPFFDWFSSRKIETEFSAKGTAIKGKIEPPANAAKP